VKRDSRAEFIGCLRTGIVGEKDFLWKMFGMSDFLFRFMWLLTVRG